MAAGADLSELDVACQKLEPYPQPKNCGDGSLCLFDMPKSPPSVFFVTFFGDQTMMGDSLGGLCVLFFGSCNCVSVRIK